MSRKPRIAVLVETRIFEPSVEAKSPFELKLGVVNDKPHARVSNF